MWPGSAVLELTLPPSHCRGSPQRCCTGGRRRQAVCHHSCPRAAAAQHGAGLSHNGGAGCCRHQGGSRKDGQAPISCGSSCSRACPPAVCAAALGKAPGERGCQVASTCRLTDGSARQKQAPHQSCCIRAPLAWRIPGATHRPSRATGPVQRHCLIDTEMSATSHKCPMHDQPKLRAFSQPPLRACRGRSLLSARQVSPLS